MTPARACREAGFTLIELAVVVFLISLTVSLLAPRFRGRLDEETLRSTTVDFGVFARNAAAKARSEGTPFWISFSQDGCGYALEDAAAGKKSLSRRLPSGVKAESKPERIAVFPDGSFEPADVVFRSGERSAKATSRGRFGDFVVET